MTKLRELVRKGSLPQIRGNFAQIGNRLDSVANGVELGPVDDFQGWASQRLLRHMARDVRAAASQYGKDIFSFAWRTRNIFEATLLLKHVTSSAEAARAFMGQKASDEKTILDGFVALAEPQDPKVAVVRGRSEEIATVLSKHGFDRASPWKMERVAEWVGMKSEYEGFYKFYSKYVHPSAWTVLSDEDEYDTEAYWEIFLIQAQLHSHHAVSVGERFNAAREKRQS